MGVLESGKRILKSSLDAFNYLWEFKGFVPGETAFNNAWEKNRVNIEKNAHDKSWGNKELEADYKEKARMDLKVKYDMYGMTNYDRGSYNRLSKTMPLNRQLIGVNLRRFAFLGTVGVLSTVFTPVSEFAAIVVMASSILGLARESLFFNPSKQNDATNEKIDALEAKIDKTSINKDKLREYLDLERAYRGGDRQKLLEIMKGLDDEGRERFEDYDTVSNNNLMRRVENLISEHISVGIISEQEFTQSTPEKTEIRKDKQEREKEQQEYKQQKQPILGEGTQTKTENELTRKAPPLCK
jgi:hypothetical protein